MSSTDLVCIQPAKSFSKTLPLHLAARRSAVLTNSVVTVTPRRTKKSVHLLNLVLQAMLSGNLGEAFADASVHSTATADSLASSRLLAMPGEGNPGFTDAGAAAAASRFAVAPGHAAQDASRVGGGGREDGSTVSVSGSADDADGGEGEIEGHGASSDGN